MKKSLIILPVAALLLIGCKGRGGETSSGDDTTSSPTSQVTPTSQVGPTVQPSTPSATSETHPDSPWPAVPTGDGTSRATPWNVTQAWQYVDQNLEKTYATSGQDAYKSAQQYYVRGWISYIEAHSDGRDSNHPHSIKFHMADDQHHTTEDEVLTKSDFVREGFCVYFADTDPALATQEAAAALEGKCVTVYGYLLNWGFEPEVTAGGVIYDVSESADVPAA